MNYHPQLLPYLSSNAPLPERLKPTLGNFLTQTSNSIATLDAEIDQLERALCAKRQKREDYKQCYEEHSRLQASIRYVPPEIWGIIFAFTLGDDPFSLWHYRTYGYLRAVCKAWRQMVAMTPDICKGLFVDLDGPLARTSRDSDDDELRCVTKEDLAPWLAIVSRNHPYQLVLGMEDEDSLDQWPQENTAEIVRWILTTGPSPNILTILTSDLFSLVHANVPQDNQISDLTLDFWQDLDREAFEEIPFEIAFPCLKTLFIEAPFECLSPMRHSHLQCLTLNQFYGSPQNFSTFLLGLPTLRELRLGCLDHLLGPEPSFTHPIIFHPRLEILVLEGEDLMLSFAYIALPSLKFFGLNAWGLREDYEILADLVPAFFERCSLDNKNIVLAIRGTLAKFIFDLIMFNIPHGSQLHLEFKINWDDDTEGVEAPRLPTPAQPHSFTTVFASQTLGDLRWVTSPPTRSRDSKPTKLYIQKGALWDDVEEAVREDFVDLSYAVEILQPDVYTTLRRSSLPKMTVKWEG